MDPNSNEKSAAKAGADKSEATAAATATKSEAAAAPAQEVAQHPMQGLGLGRVVHYALNRPLSAGENPEIVPAIVVAVNDHEKGSVNLQVFLNGSMAAPLFEQSVSYSEQLQPGTWAWPPRR